MINLTDKVTIRLRRLRRTTAVVATGAAVLALAAVAAAQPATAAGTHPTANCAVAQKHEPARVGHFSGIVRPAVAGHVSCTGTPGGDPANGGAHPPLIYHGGPMMATPASGEKIVVTPIYWASGSYSFTPAYETLINRYLADVAHDSEKSTNVFSTLFEYAGSNGRINYRFAVGTPIVDTDAFPAAGCTLTTGPVYSDGSGNTTCLSDSQVQAEIDTQLTAHSLSRDLGHIYVLMLPKGVESCFFAGNPSNQQCSINPSSSAAYCAYHSEFGGNSVYANMPFPVYESATGYSCTDESAGIQSPNANPDADVEISPLSHEISEAMTDPDTSTGWYDAVGNENGDECAYEYGAVSGSVGTFYNQVINGHDYLTQEEFSNHNFAIGQGGCLQHYVAYLKPKVTALSAHAGTHLGGKTITITGANFAAATKVLFGAKAAKSFTLVDSTKIKAVTPAHATGKVNVFVYNAVGHSVITAADKYTFT